MYNPQSTMYEHAYPQPHSASPPTMYEQAYPQPHSTMYEHAYPPPPSEAEYGPGPPIQTSGADCGPFGCNLFVFHIPNDVSNLQLYRLFAPFGNVISVRIMIEHGTGRSRGFGFVSFDSRAGAQAAIQHMNGYPLGHKRLKVQHKNEKPGRLPAADYFGEQAGRVAGPADHAWQQAQQRLPCAPGGERSW